MKVYNLPFYGFFYRLIMRIAHKYNWHYAPPIDPDGDTQLWCKWCGFRQTIKKSNQTELLPPDKAVSDEIKTMPILW